MGIVIATIDAPAADVIREALDDAGIAARFIPIRPFKQIEYLRHQHFPRLDVEVDGTDADAARALVERIEAESQAAAFAEAESFALSDEDARDPSVLRVHPPSPLRALAFAILLPVAGPIYAGSSLLTRISIVAHLVAFVLLVSGADRVALDRPLPTPVLVGGLVLVAARLLDIIASPLVAAIRNDATPHTDHPAHKDTPRAPRS